MSALSDMVLHLIDEERCDARASVAGLSELPSHREARKNLLAGVAAIESEVSALRSRVEVLEEIHREARWFSEHVYPPDVWTPEDLPVVWCALPYSDPRYLDEGSHHSKRMNWWLARALSGEERT